MIKAQYRYMTEVKAQKKQKTEKEVHAIPSKVIFIEEPLYTLDMCH
jgi:hypothetical protein